MQFFALGKGIMLIQKYVHIRIECVELNQADKILSCAHLTYFLTKVFFPLSYLVNLHLWYFTDERPTHVLIELLCCSNHPAPTDTWFKYQSNGHYSCWTNDLHMLATDTCILHMGKFYLCNKRTTAH